MAISIITKRRLFAIAVAVTVSAIALPAAAQGICCPDPYSPFGQAFHQYLDPNILGYRESEPPGPSHIYNDFLQQPRPTPQLDPRFFTSPPYAGSHP